MANIMTALGLMSGTSMDGVDVSLLETDGVTAGKRLGQHFLAYPDYVRTTIRNALGCETDTDGRVAEADKLVTDWHIRAVDEFRERHSHPIDLIGFHGQTIYHAPEKGRTWQIGNADHLADATGISVVYDFRSNDVKNGGQGAPLLPLYHQALARQAKLDFPVCVLNLGGVGNITWIDRDRVLACDTGPGNALLDDWMLKKTRTAFDDGGAAARRGAPDIDRINDWLEDPYFRAAAPKSLDRNHFAHCSVDDLSVEDGAATLAAFTVAAVISALDRMPAPVRQIVVAGGGRKNLAMMEGLGRYAAVLSPEQLGWAGDYIEAEGFAWLAVRSYRGLPLSVPGTTGCHSPTLGGKLSRAKAG